MLVPDSITTEQYAEALTAFGEAIGLDPELTCVPLILGPDAIYFSISVPHEDGAKRLTPGLGNAGSILTATGKIEVK